MVLHSAACVLPLVFKIPRLILSELLAQKQEGMVAADIQFLYTACSQNSTRSCLQGAALPSVSLGIIFSFVIELLATTFPAFLCLVKDHNMFCLASLSSHFPPSPPHPSEECWGQPLQKKEMLTCNEAQILPEHCQNEDLFVFRSCLWFGSVLHLMKSSSTLI